MFIRREQFKDFAAAGLVILFVSCFLWWLTPAHPLYVCDPIYYVGSAQSIASGHGYHSPVLEGNPTTGLYPPMQSLFLSTAWLINPSFPENQIVLKALMLGVWGAALAGLFAVLRKSGLPRIATVLITLSVGTSGIWAYHVIHCFSDILFALLAFVIIWLWTNPKLEHLEARFAVTGILLSLLYLTRTATLGFLPGAFLAALLVGYRNRNWKGPLLLVLPVALAMGAWWLAPKETFSYGKFFSAEIERFGGFWRWFQHLFWFCLAQSWEYFNGDHLLQNLSTDLPTMLRFALPGNLAWSRGVQWLLAILGIAFLSLSLYGAYRSRQDRALQAAASTYILQVLVWPFPLGFRGLLPLLPLFIVWAVRGTRALPQQWPKVCGLIGWSYLGLCLLSNLAGGPETRRLLDQEPLFADAEATGRWIKKEIPTDARLGSNFHLPMLHIYQASGHPIQKVRSVAAAVRQTGLRLDYVLTNGRYPLGKEIGTIGTPRLRVVWQSPQGNFQVWKVIPAGETLSLVENSN